MKTSPLFVVYRKKGRARPVWGRVFDFYDTLLFRIFKDFRIKEPLGLGFLKSDSKNHRFWVFQQLKKKGWV